jgi:hypothetical protein
MQVIDILAQQAAARQPFFIGSRQAIIWAADGVAMLEIFTTEPHLVSGPIAKTTGLPDQRFKVRENGWCRNSKYSAPLADAIADGVITETDIPHIPTFLNLPDGYFMPQDVE